MERLSGARPIGDHQHRKRELGARGKEQLLKDLFACFLFLFFLLLFLISHLLTLLGTRDTLSEQKESEGSGLGFFGFFFWGSAGVSAMEP